MEEGLFGLWHSKKTPDDVFGCNNRRGGGVKAWCSKRHRLPAQVDIKPHVVHEQEQRANRMACLSQDGCYNTSTVDILPFIFFFFFFCSLSLFGSISLAWSCKGGQLLTSQRRGAVPD